MKKKQILKTTFYLLLLALIIWIPMSSVIIGISLFGGFLWKRIKEKPALMFKIIRRKIEQVLKITIAAIVGIRTAAAMGRQTGNV